MKMFDDLQRRLQNEESLEQVSQLADSPDAQALGQMLDPEEIRRAVEAGDTKTLQRLLRQALSTGEGRRLAGQLDSLMGKP